MQLGLQLNSQHPATENMRDRLQELLEQVRLAQAVWGNSHPSGAVRRQGSRHGLAYLLYPIWSGNTRPMSSLGPILGRCCKKTRSTSH